MRRNGFFLILVALALVAQPKAPKAPKGCQEYNEWVQQQHYAEDLKAAQWRVGHAAMAPQHNGKLPTGGVYYVVETTGTGQGDLVAVRLSDDVVLDTTDPVRAIIRARPKK
jgi:hypothetical protein